MLFYFGQTRASQAVAQQGSKLHVATRAQNYASLVVNYPHHVRLIPHTWSSLTFCPTYNMTGSADQAIIPQNPTLQTCPIRDGHVSECTASARQQPSPCMSVLCCVVMLPSQVLQLTLHQPSSRPCCSQHLSRALAPPPAGNNPHTVLWMHQSHHQQPFKLRRTRRKLQARGQQHPHCSCICSSCR